MDRETDGTIETSGIILGALVGGEVSAAVTVTVDVQSGGKTVIVMVPGHSEG